MSSSYLSKGFIPLKKFRSLRYIQNSTLNGQYSFKSYISSSSYDSRHLTIEESLYLAQKAGIQTPWEKQVHIMRSPSFSQNSDPFLLENFFSSIENDDIKVTSELENVSTISSLKQDNDINYEITSSTNNNLPTGTIFQEEIKSHFIPDSKKTFFINGKEWLSESEGKGTCKRAVAHVIIVRGNGQIRVNNDEDLYSHWPYYYNRMDIVEPFFITKTAGIFDLFIETKGGGISGQSRAVRLALGRALVNSSPSCEEVLAQENVLYEDKRQKMPKMPGRLGARKMKSWSKR